MATVLPQSPRRWRHEIGVVTVVASAVALAATQPHPLGRLGGPDPRLEERRSRPGRPLWLWLCSWVQLRSLSLVVAAAIAA